MNETKNKPDDTEEPDGFKERIAGVVQKTIGGLEELGGILTGDPLTTAEGEFNVEVGTIREDIGVEMDDAQEDIENVADEE